MFYKVRIKDLEKPSFLAEGATDKFVLVEADNIRTARNLAAERIIEVEKATELELVMAGREGWPIISAESEKATDDGQESLSLPEPHGPTADTGEPRLAVANGIERGEIESRTLSTGSAPAWLPPMNPPATDTGD